jgi:hypothetical protein
VISVQCKSRLLLKCQAVADAAACVSYYLSCFFFMSYLVLGCRHQVCSGPCLSYYSTAGNFVALCSCGRSVAHYYLLVVTGMGTVNTMLTMPRCLNTSMQCIFKGQLLTCGTVVEQCCRFHACFFHICVHLPCIRSWHLIWSVGKWMVTVLAWFGCFLGRIFGV